MSWRNETESRIDENIKNVGNEESNDHAEYLHTTMGQNRKKHRIYSYLIIHFP